MVKYMIDQEELADRIIETPLEKQSGSGDVWEKHIELDNEKVLIVGYKEEENFCEDSTEEECVITYSWYWELRNSDTWDLIRENHDTDLSFCNETEKEPWGDESTFEEVGDISGNNICAFSDQNRIEDILEGIISEVAEWLE
jgi:hypothetical protein